MTRVCRRQRVDVLSAAFLRGVDEGVEAAADVVHLPLAEQVELDVRGVPPASMEEMSGCAKPSFQRSWAVWRSLIAARRAGVAALARRRSNSAATAFRREVGFEEDGVAGGLEAAEPGFLIGDQLLDEKSCRRCFGRLARYRRR